MFDVLFGYFGRCDTVFDCAVWPMTLTEAIADAPETIVGVALSLGAQSSMISAPKPYRHHHLISAAIVSGLKPPIVFDQGFLTSKGRFVTRWQAKRIAIRAEQIASSPHNELYSEDLW